jgi:hypothetical protein
MTVAAAAHNRGGAVNDTAPILFDINRDRSSGRVMERKHPEGYVSASPLAGAVIVLLWIDIACSFVMGALATAMAVTGGPDSEAGHLAWDGLVEGHELTTVAARIGSVVVFLVWLRRAMRNALALAPEQAPQYTPRQAIWAWFIPFVHLVRPYYVLRDLWLRSHRMDYADTQVSMEHLSWWWGLWLASIFTYSDALPNEMSLAGMASEAFSMVAALLLIHIVRGIEAYHDDKIRRLTAESARYLPPPGTAPVIG